MNVMHRRTLLAAGALFTAWASTGALSTAFAQPTVRRKLLFVIQRGAADGLAEIAPTGDPHFAALRSPFLEEAQSGLALNAMFRLHPSLVQIGALYQKKEASFVHATATAYRDRSHFDAQNVLESGGDTPYKLKTGWLNRLATIVAEHSEQPRSAALALSPDLPLALRGPAQASNYMPSALPSPDGDFLTQLNRIYGDSPDIAAALQAGSTTRAMAGDVGHLGKKDSAAAGALMARLMSGPDGADIAMLETEGWDMHANSQFPMRKALERLDNLVGAFHKAMGRQWRDMLVIVATEFGRSAAINGTKGTDHGVGGAMMLLGGTVRGGRVVADWPGLGKAQLLDGRDVRPTIAQEAAMSGAMAAHFGLEPRKTQAALFPHMANAPLVDTLLVDGLVRA